MSQSNQSKEYKRLYEQYNKKSDKELSEIAQPESGYTELAMEVASDILQSDRTEYYKNTKLQQQDIEEKQKINQEDILNEMMKDIHSIKSMLSFFVVLTVLGLFFGFYTVFVAIPKLF